MYECGSMYVYFYKKVRMNSWPLWGLIIISHIRHIKPIKVYIGLIIIYHILHIKPVKVYIGLIENFNALD